MDVIWFRDLRQLANVGNFSRAAQLVSISQPAFSRRIKALEDWVGTQLVDRSSHPVKLTAAGEQILEAGEQAVDRLEAERAKIRQTLSLLDYSVVNFGVHHSIAWCFFSPWLKEFETAYGPIVSRLRADDLPNCFLDLQKNEVDFVVCFAENASDHLNFSPKLQSLVIGNDDLIPVCKAATNGRPLFDIDDEKSAPIPFLNFSHVSSINNYIKPLINSRRLRGRIKVVYESSMVDALHIRARDGNGVAWLPRRLVMQDLKAGHLVLAGYHHWLIKLDIRIYRIENNTSYLTQKIWQFLQQRS